MATQPTSPPPGRGDLTSQAYEHIRRLIVEGRLSPGARLVELRLARRLGLSRTPIRSALQRLEQEGYVIQKETARQSHPYVAPLTADDGEEILLVLAQLEAAAARSAACLPGPERLLLAGRMADSNDCLRRLAEDGHVEGHRFSELDRAFHQALIDAAAGPRVAALHGATRPQAERYFRLYSLSLARQISASVEDHAAVVDALRKGDPDAAADAIARNWRSASRQLRGVIETLGERGSW